MKTSIHPLCHFCRLFFSAFASAILIVPPASLMALPSNVNVTHGELNLSQSLNQLNIDQLTPQAIANWQSFSIGGDQIVNINQLSAQSVLLNRVMGANPSELLGQLNANGRVFLVNPNGVLVGSGASINTAEFMASALDISDSDFLNGGDMLFAGESEASVLNLGSITAANGDVFLIAHKVANEGTISAAEGVAVLAAGNAVLLSPEGDQRVFIKTELSAAGASVENSGIIEAAQAELKAAGGNIYELAINQSGIVKATGFETKNGRILMTAEGATGGLSGSLTATNSDGSGGEVVLAATEPLL
jgi:filamentous hemagglutinin family protein